MDSTASTQQQDRPASSSDGALKRIQEETQRVRRRLTNDSGDDSIENGTYRRRQKQEQNHEGKVEKPSIEVSRSGVPIEPANTGRSQASGSSVPYVIEGSESHTFEDPVPVQNMSTHLKNEHESFKQRCV